VHVESWRIAYRGLLPDDILADLSVPDREQTWRKILADPPPRTAVLLATCGAAVVGFAAVGPDGDPPAGPERGELYAIYLRPDQQRLGIGTQLHNAAIDRLRSLGFTSATLWVLDGNEAALGLYHRAAPRPPAAGGLTPPWRHIGVYLGSETPICLHVGAWRVRLVRPLTAE
jgi:ribosomal protein S18 acetylase RimI-like enzyme